MSRVWTSRQAIWESDLAATTKIVLQALASHLNDMGEPMFPSQARLARMCSLSERAVIQHLQIAEQGGWLASRTRQLKGAKWASKEYVAAWPNGVNDVHPRGEGGSPGGVNDVHTNSPSELSIEQSCARFNEFWDEYPNKVARTKCETIWKRFKLDREADIILNRLKLWKACEQWQTARFVPHPSTFLNQERWKDTPPVSEAKPLAKGEIRVRPLSAGETVKANDEQRAFAEYKRLSKLPENIRKTTDEIWAIVASEQEGRSFNRVLEVDRFRAGRLHGGWDGAEAGSVVTSGAETSGGERCTG